MRRIVEGSSYVIRAWALARKALRAAMAAFLLFAIPHAYAGDVGYIYDEAGRLVGVVAPNGDTVRYVYDAAGNIKGMQRAGAATLSLIEFSPKSGAAGTVVQVFGSGFSPTPANNTVRFNGAPAAVTAATANQLSVVVPSGATTGPLSVTVGSTTVTSGQPFTVGLLPGTPPSITSFTPTFGQPGATVTLTGTNFDPDRVNNLVLLNGDAAQVATATSTQLQFNVPALATSGRFVVRTPNGTSAPSADDFFVAPSSINAADITRRGRLLVDGATVAVTGVEPSKYAQYLFEGTAGQSLGLGITSIAFTPGGGNLTVKVKRPDGADLTPVCATAYAPASACNLAKLPQTGTYQVLLQSDSSHTAGFSLTLSQDVSADLTPDAPTPTTFSVTRPGQNGRYIFSAVAGKSYSIALSDVTISGTWTYVYVYAPDGSQVASGFTGVGYPPPVIDVPTVMVSGVYTVFVDPYQANTGQVRLTLRETATGVLNVDGSSTPVSLLGGQNSRLTFNGGVGQNLGLGITALSTTPAGGDVRITINGPTGSSLISCNGGYGYTSAGSCSLPALPATGTYTVVVDPQGTNTASLTLTLSSDLGDVLAPNAPTPTTFSSTRPGQNGRYTFAGTAGARYSVALSDITISGIWTNAYIYAPDGTHIASGYAAVGQAFPSVDLPAAPATGTYTVVVDPYLANTGQVRLALRDTAAGTVSIDGAATPVSLLSGQNGRFTFNGTAGQYLGLGVTGLSTTPAGGNVRITINGPTGSSLISCNGGNGYTSAGACNLPALPATGVYTVVVDPQATNATALTLTLSSDMSGTLVLNDATPTTFATTRPGQNGRYTFAGVAGASYSIALSDITISGIWTNVYIYAPDGTQIASGYSAVGQAFPSVDLPAAPATGTYTVVIDPYLANTGQVRLALRETVAGTVSIDGAATPVSLLSGQNGRYTFSGAAGQNLALGVTGVSTSPSGGAVRASVNGPTGALLFACNGGNGSVSDFGCKLPALPATGAYTLIVDPAGINSASLTLTLSGDLAETLPPNATTTFVSSRPGQNGRYTFSGTVGTNYSVSLSDVTIAGTWTTVTVYGPDGAQLANGNTASGYAPPVINVPNVPSTGSYTVLVDPYQANTGQVTLLLQETGSTTPASQTPNGSISIDGAALPVSIPSAQLHLYTFSGTAGQRLGLAVSGIATTPTASVRVFIKRPDNTTILTECGISSAAFSCNVPVLPTTGTYTIGVQAVGTTSASLTLTLSTDVSAQLVANAPSPTLLSITRTGQNGRHTFNGTAGQNLSLAWSGATIQGNSSITAYRPDGAHLAGGWLSQSSPAGSMELGVLPATGVYTVFVDPPVIGGTGQVNLALLEAASAPLAIDGASTAVSLLSGQNGRYTFSGTAGQNLGLGISALATSPAGGYVWARVYDPNGVLVTDCGSYTTTSSCNLKRLPQTRTYVVLVDPTGTNTASMSLTLSSDQASVITPNAATPTLFSTSRPGQNGRYTFDGVAGQNLSMAWSEATIPGGSSFATVYRPDGSFLASNPFGQLSANGTFELGVLPATGVYTVLVDPERAGTGQVKVAVRESAAEPLTIDGASKAVSLLSGQNGRYTFSGTAGQTLGLGISALTTSPANGYVVARVYDPNGALVTDCGSYTSAWSCNLKPLQQTGSYVVLIDPSGVNTASMSLTLSSDQAGPITLNAATPVVFSTTRSGQNGRYTFNGTAGQRIGIAWAEATIPGYWSYLTMYGPSGSLLVNQTIGSAQPTGSLDLGYLSVTGTYTVLIDPAQVNTGQVKFYANVGSTGSLLLDAQPVAVSLPNGGLAEYTFPAAAGQSIGAILTEVTTAPAAPSTDPLTMQVIGPSGAVVRTCNLGSTYNASCRFPAFTTGGTYKLLIKSGPNAASFRLQLRTTI